MTRNFPETYKSIKSKHDEVFKLLDFAEEENTQSTIEKYKKAINMIDEALSTPVSLPDDTESVKDEWKKACEMIHELKKARAKILQRISKLNSEGCESEESLSLEVQENESASARTYTELAQALREMQSSEFSLDSLELIFSCDGVKLYHINSNANVTSVMENSTMRIVRMKKDEQKYFKATYFIQIINSSNVLRIEHQLENDLTSEESKDETQNNGRSLDNFDGQNGSSWIYPLVPGASPCLRTNYGAFIFPDLKFPNSELAFGILVPKDDRNDEIVLEILEAILHGVVIQPKDISQEVSKNIIRGASFISRNLIKGAEKTGSLISYSTPILISKMRGVSDSEDTSTVPQNVQTTVMVARNVTGAAAGATGYIAEKIGSATMALGRFLAPHIQKHGSTLLSKGFGFDEQQAQEKMSGVLTIAAGAVEGFATIYTGLEESAKILGKNIGENSVKVIEHKYGPSAGNVAASTFDTVGNVINVSQNMKCLTTKGIAKKTAKNAGRAIVENYRPNISNMPETVPASSLHPNLF